MIAKRLFDIFLSTIALLTFSVPIIVIVGAIKIIEKHPIFFLQERIGLRGHLFKIYKFQTMVDMQVTKTGKILRKTGLDELPQFLNVLKGQMSIVGPRAITSEDKRRFCWESDYYSLRWNLKPGITGFAQLYGGQSLKTSWFWDKKYIKSNNLEKDFCVIALSFLMNIFGKTRVRRIIWPNKNLK